MTATRFNAAADVCICLNLWPGGGVKQIMVGHDDLQMMSGGLQVYGLCPDR